MKSIKNAYHLSHASIKITGDKIIYIDPFKIKEETHDADFIFCTHTHYDHLSIDDIKKIIKPETIIVVTQDGKTQLENLNIKKVVTVLPDHEYNENGIKFKTIRAYNINKNFHPKSNNWVGYIIYSNRTSYYIAGDTDFIPEMKEVKADVVFLPVGGTYTMDVEQAIYAANIIKPKYAVPIHFGDIVGSYKDAEQFVKGLSSDIKGEILI